MLLGGLCTAPEGGIKGFDRDAQSTVGDRDSSTRVCAGDAVSPNGCFAEGKVCFAACQRASCLTHFWFSLVVVQEPHNSGMGYQILNRVLGRI